MLQWDCIIPGHLPKSDPETSVFENEVVDCIIPEPWFKMYLEVSAPVKVLDCIILEPRFKMYLEVLAPMKVVVFHHP